MANDVLVDSNVYIDLLRRGKDVVETLYGWTEMEGRHLAICGMVRLEVLRGLKSPKASQSISALMEVMIHVPTDSKLWHAATNLAWELDRKGLVISGPDALIAASALKIGAAIMTSDMHFSKVDGLQVIAPPEKWFV